MRKTQILNLSLGVFGQIKAQSGQMSSIVREVPGAVKHKHRLKRFFRFLSNPSVKPESLQPLWVNWCVRTFCHEQYLKVAIDWTTLPGNIQCLMLAIPFHGRAIPLLWQLVLHSKIKDSQNRIEERLVARLNNLVAHAFPAKKLILSADRGFGRASLMQFLLQKRVLFVLRVRGDVHITPVGGTQLLLRKIGQTLQENTPVWFANISYRGDSRVNGINLVAVVAKPKKNGAVADPWFLVTNLRKPETTIARYEERFQIEEWFKDLKHRFGIATMQTRNLKRVRRLVFLSCVAYGVTMLIGTVADRRKTVKEQLITGRKKAGSRIWFAIQIIKHKLLGTPFWKKVYLVGTAP
ncbi:MAG: IS4 family transposase [Nitrososphaeraceae archaeon]